MVSVLLPLVIHIGEIMSLDYSYVFHSTCMLANVRLDSFYQSLVYSGLSEGHPNARLNDLKISGLKRQAIRLFSHGEFEREPLLLEPKRRSYLRKPGDMDGILSLGRPIEWLPMVGCIGLFVIDSMVTSSSLVVCWFQDDFAMPIDGDVIEQIQKIDWKYHSKTFEK